MKIIKVNSLNDEEISSPYGIDCVRKLSSVTADN